MATKPGAAKTSGAQQSGSSQKSSLSAPENRIAEPWENQPCPLCKAIKSTKRCDGHGGGSGGGSGGGGESGDKKAEKDETQAPNALDQLFNFAMVMNNNTESVFTFKLQSSPYHLLSEVQKNELKIIDIVLKELEAFKKENDIFADCKTITQDANGEILSISLPTASLNAAFIQRLANKNLLPIQDLAQTKEKAENQEGKYAFNPTPLLTKLIPSLKRNEEEKEKETEKQNLSEEPKKPSAIRPKGPRDKLKPNGWE